jgi:hypothetical protein
MFTLQFSICSFESFHRKGLAEIRGPIIWPSCSPALVPLYYICGYIKDAVCIQPLPTILLKLVWNIPTAAATGTPAMHTNIWTELEYRYISAGLLMVPALKIVELLRVGHKTFSCSLPKYVCLVLLPVPCTS